MSHHPRKMFPPVSSRKRKEAEPFYSIKPSAAVTHLPAGPRADKPAASNRLLAGYMAYEFLTKGTLLGEKFDPARSEAVSLTEPKIGKAEAKPQQGGCDKAANKRYAEVAGILKTNGAHIPGVVNPTELTRWLQR